MPITNSLVATRATVHPQGFNVLRILAAGAVIVDHSAALPQHETLNPLHFGDYTYGLGRIGVLIFFTISGYLITGSWLSNPTLRDFARKRALRIYPALLLMLLLCTFVLGPIVSQAPNYLANNDTWLYLVRNALIVPYDYHLPGVFVHNPQPVVNGVLWTLGVEIFAYALVALLGVVGVLKKPRIVLVLAILLVLASFKPVDSIVPGYEPFAIRAELLACFFLAAAVRVHELRLGGRGAICAIAAVCVATTLNAPLSIIVAPAVVMVVLFLGNQAWTQLRPVMKLGDPSYGMYIYTFVAQQLLVSFGLGRLPTVSFAAISIGIGLILGYASWHFVEERALKIGGSSVRARSVTTAQQAAAPKFRQ